MGNLVYNSRKKPRETSGKSYNFIQEKGQTPQPGPEELAAFQAGTGKAPVCACERPGGLQGA